MRHSHWYKVADMKPALEHAELVPGLVLQSFVAAGVWALLQVVDICHRRYVGARCPQAVSCCFHTRGISWWYLQFLFRNVYKTWLAKSLLLSMDAQVFTFSNTITRHPHLRGQVPYVPIYLLVRMQKIWVVDTVVGWLIMVALLSSLEHQR